MAKPAGITLEAHPAERGRRRSEVTLCAGCCSCCCCLHSVGGVLGAVMGSAMDAPAWSRDPNPFRKDAPSVNGLYWGLSGLVWLVALAWGIWAKDGRAEGALAGVCGLIMLLPAVQLGVSALAAVYIVLDFRYEDKGAYLQPLGRITAYALCGGLAGLALMTLGCVGMIAVSR